MPRRLVLLLLITAFGGCARPELADTPVAAASAGELSAFRAGLGERFAKDQLQAFDTAVQELKLDGMNRGVPTAEAREEAMRKTVNGKTVRAVEVLGWQARRARLLGEIELMSGLLQRDQKLAQDSAARGTPEPVLSRIRNEEEIIARLRRDVTAAEAKLAGWGAAPAAATKSSNG